MPTQVVKSKKVKSEKWLPKNKTTTVAVYFAVATG
jgi:hypothetical protein